jgi:hypothetical protein
MSLSITLSLRRASHKSALRSLVPGDEAQHGLSIKHLLLGLHSSAQPAKECCDALLGEC